jgi:hypothetical protein
MVDYVGSTKSCIIHYQSGERIDVKESSTGQKEFLTVSQYAKNPNMNGKACPGKGLFIPHSSKYSCGCLGKPVTWSKFKILGYLYQLKANELRMN